MSLPRTQFSNILRYWKFNSIWRRYETEISRGYSVTAPELKGPHSSHCICTHWIWECNILLLASGKWKNSTMIVCTRSGPNAGYSWRKRLSTRSEFQGSAEVTWVGSAASAPCKINMYVAPADNVPDGMYSCGIPAASEAIGMSMGPDICKHKLITREVGHFETGSPNLSIGLRHKKFHRWARLVRAWIQDCCGTGKISARPNTVINLPPLEKHVALHHRAAGKYCLAADSDCEVASSDDCWRI